MEEATLVSALVERYCDADESPEERQMRPKGSRPPLRFASVAGCGITRTKAATVEPVFASLTHIDLSRNALADWSEAFAPASLFPALSSLDLSDNLRLPRPVALVQPSSPLRTLRVLALNHCTETGLCWADVLALAAAVPCLQELSLAGNAIAGPIEAAEDAAPLLPQLRSLNLDYNALATWTDVSRIVGRLAPGLVQLLVSGNKLGSVAGDMPNKEEGRPFAKVAELSVADNKIADWDSIAALADAFPSMRALRVLGNPLLNGMPPLAARVRVFAALPALESLNGSTVRPAEQEEGARLKQQQQQQQQHSGSSSSTAPQQQSGFVLFTIQCNAASGTKQGAVQQKLPGSMTVRDLRQLCQRLFGVAAADQALFFRERQADTVGAFPQPMDDDSHELRMYSGSVGGVVVVEDSKR